MTASGETEESLWAMAIGKAVLPVEESLLDGTRRVRPTAQRLWLTHALTLRGLKIKSLCSWPDGHSAPSSRVSTLTFHLARPPPGRHGPGALPRMSPFHSSSTLWWDRDNTHSRESCRFLWDCWILNCSRVRVDLCLFLPCTPYSLDQTPPLSLQLGFLLHAAGRGI